MVAKVTPPIVHIWWEGESWLVQDGDCLLDLLSRMDVKDLEELKSLCNQVINEKNFGFYDEK